MEYIATSLLGNMSLKTFASESKATANLILN